MILLRFGRLVGVLALALAPSFALAQTALQQPCTDATKCTPLDYLGTAVNKLYQNDLYLQSVVNSPLPQVVALQAQLASLQATVASSSGATPGTYGSAGLIPVVTVDLRGRVTGISTIAAGQTSISAGTISANLTGTSAPPTGSTLSAILDSQIGATRATIAVRGASTWGAYTPVTSGCTFQFNGTDTVCAASSPGTGAVRYDASQGLTSGQQAQGRGNIAAAAAGANSDITSLSAPALGAATATTPAASDSSTKVPTTAFLTSATVRGDVAQVLTGTQQAQARANVGLNSAGALAYRNRLVNGNFAVNQRGAASASTAYAAGAYVMDRWKAGSGGATLSFATAANGDVTVTITAGTLVQVIEGGFYLPEGGAYVLSWSGTATARVYQGAASGSYAASPVAVSSLTGGTNTTVELGTGTLALAQFEPGTAATTFERRDDELRRCRRYYYASTFTVNLASLTAGSGPYLGMWFTWPGGAMRIAPNVAVTGGTTGTFASGYPTASTVSVDGAMLRGDQIGAGTLAFITSITASAEL